MGCRTIRAIAFILLISVWQALLPPRPVHAEVETLPPDGARVVGSKLVVPFHWGGKPGLYRLNVFRHDGQVVHSGVVYGNVARVPLAPCPMYQWTLEVFDGQRLREVVSRRTFQLSSELTYSYDGQTGPPGGQGGPGQSLSIRLRSAGDYVAVRIDAALPCPEILLLPSSSPIVVTCRGGAGGSGDSGYASAVLCDPQGNRYKLPGAPGGPGGNGGDGGAVRVIANGLPWTKFVTVLNAGGRGGVGGRSRRTGSPGRPGAVTVQ